MRWKSYKPPLTPFYLQGEGGARVNMNRRAYSTFFYSCYCIYSVLAACYLYHAYRMFLKLIKTPSGMHSSTHSRMANPSWYVDFFIPITWQHVIFRDKTVVRKKHVCRVHITIACLCAVVWHWVFFKQWMLLCAPEMNKVVDWQLITGCGMHAKKKSYLV